MAAHNAIPNHVSVLAPLVFSIRHPISSEYLSGWNYQLSVLVNNEQICMLDGPDYPNPLAKSVQDDLVKENERLKALLLDNGISWVLDKQKPKEPVKVHNMKTRKSSASENQLPHIPMEIQLRILGYAMKCSFPITDPFYKPRVEHLSKDERMKRKELPVRKYNLKLIGCTGIFEPLKQFERWKCALEFRSQRSLLSSSANC
jgi:hypothetical protein